MRNKKQLFFQEIKNDFHFDPICNVDDIFVVDNIRFSKKYFTYKFTTNPISNVHGYDSLFVSDTRESEIYLNNALLSEKVQNLIYFDSELVLQNVANYIRRKYSIFKGVKFKLYLNHVSKLIIKNFNHIDSIDVII